MENNEILNLKIINISNNQYRVYLEHSLEDTEILQDIFDDFVSSFLIYFKEVQNGN